MVLGLLAGVATPLVLKATGLDKKIVKGIQDTPRELKKVGKAMGFKHGGMVKKTGKHLVHKGEFVIPAKDVKKIQKMVKQQKAKAKPKAKSKK